MFPPSIAWTILVGFTLLLAGVIVTGVVLLVRDFFSGDWW